MSIAEVLSPARPRLSGGGTGLGARQLIRGEGVYSQTRQGLGTREGTMGAEKVYGHDAKASAGRDLCCHAFPCRVEELGRRQAPGMVVGHQELESSGTYLPVGLSTSVS